MSLGDRGAALCGWAEVGGNLHFEIIVAPPLEASGTDCAELCFVDNGELWQVLELENHEI